MTLTPSQRKWVRGLVDYAGLLLFFVGAVYHHFDLVKASWWLVVGSAVALIVDYALERRIAPMPLIAGGAALVFGSLTLVFHDDRFIKMKPTFLYLAFTAFLLGGLAFRRNPLKLLAGAAMHLTDAGWRTLTLRYGLFFLFLAVLNEIVWRTQSNAVWAGFKAFGITGLIFAFVLTQTPLIMKSSAEAEAADKQADPPPSDE